MAACLQEALQRADAEAANSVPEASVQALQAGWQQERERLREQLGVCLTLHCLWHAAVSCSSCLFNACFGCGLSPVDACRLSTRRLPS